MIHLVEKEFKINPKIFSFKKENIFSSILGTLLAGVMVAVSTYMFTLLYNKFAAFNAETAFAIIYLFLLTIVSLMYAVVIARKTFFNERDNQITITKPIDRFALIGSKALYLFLVLLTFELILFAPHYVTFGIKAGRFPGYYMLVIFSIIFHTLFDLGVALILIIGLEAITRFLKRNVPMRVILTLLVMITLTAIYGYVLMLFLNLINGNTISYLFSAETIRSMKVIASKLYPDVFISQSLLTMNVENVFAYYSIAIAIFIMGIVILYIFFPLVVNLFNESNTRRKKKLRRSKNQTMALFKKEFLVMTRDNENPSSFTSLVVIGPILTVMVVASINSSFKNGIFSIYAAILPNFMQNVNILIVLLFSSLISLGGSSLLRSEDKSIRLVKIIPYSLTKQMFVKMSIPLLATVIANTLALVALVSFNFIGWKLFVFLLFAVILLNASLIALSFRSEIQNFRKPNNPNSLASFIAVFLPAIIVAFNMVTSIMWGFSEYLVYSIDIGVLLILGAFVGGYLKRNFRNDIHALEVIN